MDHVDEPRPPSLYQILLGMIETSPHILEGDGKYVIEVDTYGTLEVQRENEEEHTFTFTDLHRLFVLRRGQDLVEVVQVPQFAVDASRPDPVTPEDYLRLFLREHSVPDSPGDTVVIVYGAKEDKVCLLTRTNRGIIGDFLTEDIKLFYDHSFRTIRSYADVVASEQKVLRLKIEREKQKLIRAKQATDPVDQLDYDGSPEVVDRAVYSNRIVCECGNIRYVKNADIHEVKRCKPCQKAWKNSGKGRRKKRRKEERGGC